MQPAPAPPAGLNSSKELASENQHMNGFFTVSEFSHHPGEEEAGAVYLKPGCKVLEELPGLLLFINVLV